MRNGGALTPKPPPPRENVPALTVSKFLPSLPMSSVTLAVAPRPTDTSAITAPTPITTPSIVNTERRVLRRISRRAMKIVAQIMRPPR